MKHLKVIPADPVAKDRPARVVKAVTLGVICPDTPAQPDFDGSPRLLPVSWLDTDDQAA